MLEIPNLARSQDVKRRPQKLITAHTAKFHLGHTYSDAYEDAYAHNLNRVKPQFNFAEQSLLNTIRPNRDNARLIRKARFELSSLSSPDGTAFDSYVSLHLRRGDRGPAFYHGEYVPVRDFVSAGTDAWQRLNPGKSASSLMFYVATDSSTIQREVVGLTAARYTTYSLYQSADPELRGVASPEEYRQKEFDTLEKTARIRATQGMIVDFALLSGAWANEDDALPQATVCTISSNVCKMAAVGLGWERAFGVVDSMGYLDDAHKRWVEIDQKGTVVPVWQPFELF
ncbi:hypothetical protein H0H81_006870 [Sphagnurus paluster]|uniref:Uncharacterized protein n=1 Tax=Sphagnurus paluster TaxID=117069 RepID=A0A9P7GQ17_9AGAR|nr:hypothetical protein H0H81_006870 [Sphagnurus paluster]